jgi:2',3'-cyclic-nucleotide 2'-phosphodiesterase (5'-nucleotidase family)
MIEFNSMKKRERFSLLAALSTMAVFLCIVSLSFSDASLFKALNGGSSDYCVLPSGYSTIQEIVTNGRAASKTTSASSYPASSLDNTKYSFRATFTKIFDYRNGYMQSKDFGILVYSSTNLLSSYHVGEFVDVKDATYALYSGRHQLTLDGATITVLADTNPSPVTIWNNPASSSIASTDYSGRLVSLNNLSFSAGSASYDSSTYSFGYIGSGSLSYTAASNITYFGNNSITADFSGIISERYSTGTDPSLNKELVIGQNSDLVPQYGTSTVDVVSMNDLHGAIEPNPGDKEPGLARIGSFLTQNFSSSDMLLANGDMWQGNGESNMNQGALITKWMNAKGFDAMSIGNHDFDWGQSVLTTNKGLADFALLGGNIYNYASDTLDTDISDGATKVFTKSGVKIGVIGMIGSGEYTSINNKMVSNLTFKSPIALVQSCAQTLRNTDGCDLVFLEIHDGVATTTYSALCDSTQYVDAIFGGHTHTTSIKNINGVPLVMTTGKDQLSHVYVGTKNGSPAVLGATIDNVPLYGASDSVSQGVIDQYASQNTTLDESVGFITTAFSNSNLANLYCQKAYEYVNAAFSGVQLVVSSNARNDIPSGAVTFRDLYRAMPFDNILVIGTVSGGDLYKETVTYTNNFYHPASSFTKPTSGSTTLYTIAVLDYMAYHVNTSRVRDYFPSLTVIGELSSGTYLPRDILRAYFLSQQSLINPGDFANTYAQFSYQ